MGIDVQGLAKPSGHTKLNGVVGWKQRATLMDIKKQENVIIHFLDTKEKITSTLLVPSIRIGELPMLFCGDSCEVIEYKDPVYVYACGRYVGVYVASYRQ